MNGTRKRAVPGSWARNGKTGKATCTDCGREFTHPSQYKFIGDDVLCRDRNGCADRMMQRLENGVANLIEGWRRYQSKYGSAS